MAKSNVTVTDATTLPEFAALVATMRAKAGADADRKEAAGNCSELAKVVQAETAALYAVTRAFDKVHNPRADILAGQIRDGMAAAEIGKESINLACKDALAICRHSDFKGISTSAGFLAAFETLELKTAGAVRAHATGKVVDKVAKLAKQVGALSDTDRKRFELLLGSYAATDTTDDAAA